MSGMEPPSDGAIQQLIDLGINRQQAKNALSKYNNDVVRAADYIFSGFAREDDEPPPLLDQSPPNQNSWTWSETPIDPGYTDTPGAWREGQWTNTDTSGTWEERPKDNEAVVLVNDSPVVDSSNPKQANNYPQELQRALDASVGDRERADIEKATAESLAHSRPAELTVAKSSHYNADQWALVTVNKDENDLNLNRAIEASYAATYTSTSMSLTWWSDPDDPRSRSRVPGLPTALRPSDSAYQFTPSIIQALYHVPVFREAVLAYRPSLESWGYTDEYWRGMGSNLPEMQLMQVTEDKEMQPRYTTMTKPLPSAAKSFYELQKLFAFMLLTQRSYGNVSHLLHSFQLPPRDGWDDIDRNVNGLLEILLNSLTEADKFKSVAAAYEGDFRSLFFITAQSDHFDENGISTQHDEDEEANYLTFALNNGVKDLYGCFDMLMCESFPETSTTKYVFFEKLPEIMIINLDQQPQGHGRNWGAGGSHYHREFSVDKVLYMDRYMVDKKNLILQRHTLKKQWIRELEAVRREYEGLINIGIGKKRVAAIDLLCGTLDYFLNTKQSLSIENDTASADIVADCLSQSIEQVQRRIRDLEAKQEQLEQSIIEVFDTPDMRSFTYRLHAVLMYDGSSGSGHHWAYVWVRQTSEDEGQWMRFCDAEVRKVSEEDVFNDRTGTTTGAGVYALIYLKGLLEANIDRIADTIPQSLKAFINQDNQSHAKEVRNYVNRSRNQEDMISRDSSSSSPPIYKDAAEPDETTPTLGSGMRYLGTGAETPMSKKATILMFEMDQVQSDDYRILQRFEYYLAKVGNTSALQYLLNQHVDSERLSDDEPLVIAPAARQDPQLFDAYQAFDNFTQITALFSAGLECMLQNEHARGLEYFLDAKRKEAQWVHGYLVSTEIRMATPRAEELSRVDKLLTYGKVCLQILDENARNKVLNVAYRSRGLEDAIRIAQQALTLVGPENVLTDPFLVRLREQWLQLTESLTESLEGPQSELLNKLVMIYLNDEFVSPSPPTSEGSAETFVGGPVPESTVEHVLPRYQDVVPEGGETVRDTEVEIVLEEMLEEMLKRGQVQDAGGSATMATQAVEPVWKRYRDAKQRVDMQFRQSLDETLHG